MIMITILVPVFAGIVLLLLPEWKNRRNLCCYTAVFLVLTCVLTGVTLLGATNEPVRVFNLTKTLPILFKVDGISRFFAVITSIVWMAAGLYSFSYMSHEQNEKRYYGFYLVVYGILLGLDFSGNLITFYAFYELMTLASMPLVLHNGTKEAILAGLKYLLFSFAGAYMALFGLYFLNRYANTLTFTAGGVLDMGLIVGHESLLLVVAFLMLLGFGVKAGMFPMHAWLPTAHPVAPAPASGALSGIIVKAGVLGTIRTVYYLFGADFLKGNMGAEDMACADFDNDSAGFHDGVSGKGDEKTAGVFNGQSGVVYSVRTCHDDSGKLYGGDASYGGSCSDEMRPVPDCGCFYL